jgi:putative alpha-1,2-mannosidase
MGGADRFVDRLDELFALEADEEKYGHVEDIAGLIGQYAHGNEPSQHIPYLYAYAGRPWRTQERVRQIVDTLFDDTPAGISGNEDCGQMSAWYLFTALGFYPVAPGSNQYVIGAPQVPARRSTSAPAGASPWSPRTSPRRISTSSPYASAASPGRRPTCATRTWSPAPP